MSDTIIEEMLARANLREKPCDECDAGSESDSDALEDCRRRDNHAVTIGLEARYRDAEMIVQKHLESVMQIRQNVLEECLNLCLHNEPDTIRDKMKELCGLKPYAAPILDGVLRGRSIKET